MLQRILSMGLLTVLSCSLNLTGSDLVNDGEELDPGATEPSPVDQKLPSSGQSALKEPLKLVDEGESEPPAFSGMAIESAASLTPAKPEHVFNRKPDDVLESSASTPATQPNTLSPINDLPAKAESTHTSAQTQPELGDLTADLPGDVSTQRRSPFFVAMEDFQPTGLISPKVRTAYELIAQLKTQAYQISDDLDNGGKEKTRLIQTSQWLGQSVQKLYELWPDDQDFRDRCISAKRSTLVLEEQLGMEPRRWTQVRWAFGAVQREIQRVRVAAVAKAESDPKPIRTVVDGKEVLLIPSAAEVQSKRAVEDQRIQESYKQVEDLKKERGLTDKRKEEEDN